MKYLEKLKEIPLFTPLKDNEEYIARLSEIIEEEKFSRGSLIIREGEVSDKMYILKKGIVIIEKQTLCGDRFRVAKLDDRMNVFFGEMALLDNDLRSASVQAETDTECYVIHRDDFIRLCKDYPAIGYHIATEIAKSLARKLRKTTKDNMYLINELCGRPGDAD